MTKVLIAESAIKRVELNLPNHLEVTPFGDFIDGLLVECQEVFIT